MVEKTKLVKLPLKAWQVAKHAAIDAEQPISKWLEDAVYLKLKREKEVSK